MTSGCFERDPPTFLNLPYSYSEIDPIMALLQQFGSRDLDIDVVAALIEMPDPAASWRTTR